MRARGSDVKIVFLNPNATQAMTDSICDAARAVIPQVDVTGWTNKSGPPAIQGEADGQAALPGLIDGLDAAGQADAIVIACFDDTGLHVLRKKSQVPVIGIGQAAFHMGSLVAGGFSVLTTLDVSVPVIEGNIQLAGFGSICGGVIASGIPVLEVEAGQPSTLSRLAEQVRRMSKDGAASIVLGCAGMSAHRDILQDASDVPVIDPVRSAATLALAMVNARR